MTPIDVARLNAAQRIAATARIARTDAARTGHVPAEPGIMPPRGTAAGEAPIDADRVEALRQSIGRGDYPLDSEVIADAMIAAGHVAKDER